MSVKRNGLKAGDLRSSDTGVSLGLGTVQFGMPYGIANPKAATKFSEIEEILKIANSYGIQLLDTASSYGNAEQVLGRLPGLLDKFSVVTKISPISADQIDSSIVKACTEEVNRSVVNLGGPLHGVLLHRGRDLLMPGGERLVKEMHRWVQSGLTKKVGVSVYDPIELERVLGIFDPEIVQFPMNIFDRRFERSGLLADLASRGCELHARSLLLQGLLIESREKLEVNLSQSASRHLAAYMNTAPKERIARLSQALACVQSSPYVTTAILGVYTQDQMYEACEIWGRGVKLDSNLENFVTDDEDLLNPQRWLP